MPTKKRNIFTKILIWRYKHISERQFLLVLSIFVGFLAGLGTVILKYLTLFIQSVFEGGFIIHCILYSQSSVFYWCISSKSMSSKKKLDMGFQQHYIQFPNEAES